MSTRRKQIDKYKEVYKNAEITKMSLQFMNSYPNSFQSKLLCNHKHIALKELIKEKK